VADAPDRSLLIGPISASGQGPLYEQIVQSLKREISEGRLAPGTALPSFRGLAEDLLVSVITVKRAYEELEREGIIYRRQGLGTFVSDVATDLSREAKLERARELFRDGAREAAEAGLTPRDIIKLAQSELKEHAAAQLASGGASAHVRKRA
jgi:GntR family transcriptional regulator